MSKGYSIPELAQRVGGTLRGESSARITGVADVSEAGPSDATFVSNDRYITRLNTSGAGVVLIPKGFGDTPMAAIECERIDRAVASLLAAFAQKDSRTQPGVHPTAVVHETASVGSACTIGAHAVIEADATIGDRCVIHPSVFIGRGSTLEDDCLIWPNVVIRDGCRIGNRVIIHPGAVIGADGFGYYFDEGRHRKIEHIGGVILEDDVEVGACSCIDRAKFGNTFVGRGTKIDNLVQIAHNVRIGDHCILAGATGLGGSVRVGNYCVFGGGTRVTDGAAVGDRTRVGLCAVVTRDVAEGVTVSGFPAQEHRRELREEALRRRLPELVAQLKDLVARVERLETSADDSS